MNDYRRANPKPIPRLPGRPNPVCSECLMHAPTHRGESLTQAETTARLRECERAVEWERRRAGANLMTAIVALMAATVFGVLWFVGAAGEAFR